MPKKAVRLRDLTLRYTKARAARLEADKKVDALKQTEKEAHQAIMDYFHGKAALLETGSVVDGYLYQLKTSDEPTVEDWPKLYAHIKRTGNFEMLYRRVNPAAVKERWDDGKAVPGVGKFPVEKLSITKAK